jgi:hypothetical protein
MGRFVCVALALGCAAALGGCGLKDKLVTADDVAGTHQGALEGISVATRDDLDHKESRIIVDMDILHEIVIEKTGEFEVTLSSEIIPPIHAIILGVGPVAMDVKVLDIELSDSPDDHHLKSVEVDRLVFVKYQEEWVLALQMAKIGLVPEEGSTVNAYQYVSYPASVAQQMSQDEAIQYVDAVLDLASQAQRL